MSYTVSIDRGNPVARERMMIKKLVLNPAPTPALAMVRHCRQQQPVLFLDHCICLYATALQKFSQRHLAVFEAQELMKLLQIYNKAHQAFMNLTANILQHMEQLRLIETSFDIALVSKMKASNKFFQKAQTHMFSKGSMEEDANGLRNYFHNIAASLSNCIDVNVDVMRSTEAAFISYVRRAKTQNVGLKNGTKIDASLKSIKESQTQLQHFRQLVANANINVSHDTILLKFISLIERYIIPSQKLKPLLS